jgi:organic hydroperoxide reductase OsmC/OhrA
MDRVAVKAKELRFAVDLRDDLRTEDGTALGADPAWTAEHLLLAALLRCSVTSLGYHARRAGTDVDDAHGSARCLVTKREGDGRYAVVELDVEIEARLRTQLGEAEVQELVEKAERDCFIGASLAVKPRYTWSVG